MTETIATLPMYDWPEVTAQTDRLWAFIRDSLRARGINAPPTLDRDTDREVLWRHPRLVLGQTCGLPYRSGLMSHVQLVGSPAYSLKNCAPGDYYSVLIVRPEDAARPLAAFRETVAVFNAPDSQSGYAALRHLFAPLSQDGRFFSRTSLSGSHRESIRRVAAGHGDIAAIDAVSWALARRHEPAARGVKVIAQSPQTPGLPLITSLDFDVQEIAGAFEEAISELSNADRDALLLSGLRRREPDDYAVIDDMAATAASFGYSELN